MKGEGSRSSTKFLPPRCQSPLSPFLYSPQNNIGHVLQMCVADEPNALTEGRAASM